MVGNVGFEPTTPLLPKQVRYQTAPISVIIIYLVLDAPLGLEPRLTDSKSALLPLEEGAMSGIEPQIDVR